MRAPSTPRETLGVDVPYETCEIDGLDIAYRQIGRGPDVICLHAIGHGGGDFDSVVPALSQHHRLTVLDWPGHGRSSEDSKPPGVARFGEILAGFIEKLGLADVVLIGNSVGGGAAIHYASRAPGNVRALVLANPAGLVAQTPRTRRALKIMGKFFAAGVARRWWYTPAFRFYYRLVLQRPPARERRSAIVNARFEVAALLEQTWNGFADPLSDLRSEAALLQCPVLFTWAMRDRFVRYDLCRDAIRSVPNAKLEKFDAGHTPFLETPDQFITAVGKFLG